MNKSTRKAIIAGNWKMNKTRPEAKELLEAIKPLVANAEGNVEVIACVPFTNLETAINTTAGSNVKVGAENVHFEKSGAFTGEISADMRSGFRRAIRGICTVDMDCPTAPHRDQRLAVERERAILHLFSCRALDEEPDSMVVHGSGTCRYSPALHLLAQSGR